MTTKLTLEQLRANIGQDEQGERTGLPNNYFPFWKMKEGERAIIRFIPDKNPDNPRGFLAQKVMHVLEINGEKKSVPCLSMYGEDCPICKVSQDFYKVEGKDSPNGKKYWKKKQHIAQAIVLEDPLPADEKSGDTHVGRIRYIALGFQLYQIIQNAFKSDETLESIPYNFEDGYDFIIQKDKGPKYPTYQLNSKFRNKQRALSEDELAIVAESMSDLSVLLPKHPGKEKVEAMLQAALTGDNYQGPAVEGEDVPDVDDVVPVKRTAPAPVKAAVVDDEPFVKPAPKSAPKAIDAEAASDVDEMLATIKARRAAAKAATA
jgi:hypothetical protein